MTGKFFFSGGGLNFGPRICLGFVWNRWALIFAPIRSSLPIIPVTWIGGWVNLSGGGWRGVSVEIPVGWWKRDSPAFRSPEVGISDSALANHPTQFLPLLESIGFPPFKASRLARVSLCSNYKEIHINYFPVTPIYSISLPPFLFQTFYWPPRPPELREVLQCTYF